MTEPTRILIVEDRATDAELAEREIKNTLASCQFRRVETREDFLIVLAEFQPDLIISDYRMPRFDGLTALKLALEHAPLTPLIILTGAINEDTAVECMKAGAVDYVIKEHLKRLGQAVTQALEKKQLRQERHRTEEALRQSEERFRTLVRTLPDAIVVTDPNGNITYVPPATLAFFGYAAEVEVTGHNILKWVDAAYQQQALDHIETVLSGGLIKNAECLLFKKDGTSFFGEISASCLKDTQGQVVGINIIVRDITERKQDREALKAYSEQLEEMVEARTKALKETQMQLVRQEKLAVLGQLAGGVGHELRNPLGVISNSIYFLQTILAEADEVVKEYLDFIANQVQEANKIVSDLLNLSRTQPTVKEPVVLVDLVAEILQRHPPPEGVNMVTTLKKELPVLFVDSQQIRQVLTNLIINAYQAMTNGGTLTIGAQAMATHIHISISDTGDGISAETMTKIFEPLFTTKTKGIGLGLPVTKNLVAVNDGKIEVQSVEGKGSTFTITLPIKADDEQNLARN